MTLDDTEYEVVIATDVERDSMQWECYLKAANGRQLLLEIVRFDGKKEWAFIQHTEILPLSLVEYAVTHAKAQFGPFFEG